MRALRDLIRRALTSIFTIPESPERSHEQHRAIRAAIAAGEPIPARAAMRDHLVRVESDVRDALGGGPSTPNGKRGVDG
jgi:DNA-binding FadR family transcriptional regulator